ncbi:MAG: hypothetical protein P8J37_05995 [Fuerstiella sp.]|nr:hypothetical protein [Fuerstiella sp.]
MRIDSYESEEHQQYVRTFLDGRFENSAFCLLSPDGQDWLTKAGRGPEMVLGRSLSSSVEQMEIVAALYPATADVKQAEVQDFHSVRQALNVASADQRVLVVVNGPGDRIASLRNSLRSVASDEGIIGRFHIDFEEDDQWRKTVTGLEDGASIVVIRPGEFGMDGTVMNQLPLNAETKDITAALLAANTEFSGSTDKKVYSGHVAKGQELGIYFEGGVPYGEDRNGDGQIDRGGFSGARVDRPRR